MAKKLADELIYSEQGNEVLLVNYVDPPLSQADSDNVRDPKPIKEPPMKSKFPGTVPEIRCIELERR